MRKLLRRHLPHPDALGKYRLFAPFRNTLLHPRLWHLNRRSAAGGFAVGIFSSLIPGPLQMPGAAILCVIFRVNLPLALIATVFSNPFTILPLYLLAFALGSLIAGSRGTFVQPPALDWQTPVDSLQAWGLWIYDLGQPLLIGLPVLALLFAAASYFGVKALWGFWLRREWHKRRAQRGR